MTTQSRVKTIQSNFTAGELNSSLKGRIDKDLYFRGAALLRNVYVNPQGHISRREGLGHIAFTYENVESRLITFEYSTIQKYLLVFSAGRFRVYKDDVLQTTFSGSPISSLTLTQIKEACFRQSANKLYIFHKSFKTIEITRSDHTVWTATQVNYENIPWFAFNGPTLTSNASAGHLTPANVSGYDVSFTTQNNFWSAASVGQYIYGKRGGVARITSYVSPNQVLCRIEVDFPNTNNIDPANWEYETGYELAWSNARGWPSVGTFHQNRLWVANTGSQPQTLWGSVVGDMFNFNIGSSADDEAIDITIDDDKVNAIINLVSSRNLLLFTSGGEFYIPTDPSNPITPSKILIAKSTSHGSSSVAPVIIGGAIVFIEASGKVVREYVFNELEQNFSAPNLTLLCPQVINSPIASAMRQSRAESPAEYFYVVNGDGTMAVLSTARDQELTAWSVFETQGFFEDVVSLGNDVYVIVRRTINNQIYRSIEKLNYAYKLDCSAIYTNSTPKVEWSGITHLNNQIVKVIGDDFILDDETISSNSLTTATPISKLEIGYFFAARIKTFPIEAGNGVEQLAGDWKRLVYANLNLKESRNLVVKVGGKRYSPSFTNFGSQVLDQPVSLFTGWKKVFLQGADRDVQIEITQDHALEFQILSLVIAIK